MLKSDVITKSVVASDSNLDAIGGKQPAEGEKEMPSQEAKEKMDEGVQTQNSKEEMAEGQKKEGEERTLAQENREEVSQLLRQKEARKHFLVFCVFKEGKGSSGAIFKGKRRGN